MDDEASGGSVQESVQYSLSGNRVPRFKRLFWATDRLRLAAYLQAYDAELAELAEGNAVEARAWQLSARRLVRRADEELGRGNIYAGWGCYNAARRIAVLGLDDDELRALEDGLWFEANQKLAESWRLPAIESILRHHSTGAHRLGDESSGGGLDPGDVDTQMRPGHDALQVRDVTTKSPEASRLLVRLAMELRDESLQNHYWKFHHLRRQLRILGAVLASALAALIPLILLNPHLLQEPIADNVGTLSLLATLFGVLGGCLSAFRTYTPDSLRVRIPEMFSNAIITILRPLVGGAAGLISLAFLTSGAVRFGSDIGAVALSIAFVAGFSERLVLGVVDSIAAGGK